MSTIGQNQSGDEPQQKETFLGRAEIRRQRVTEMVLEGVKTEQEIADELGCSRCHVARIKHDARVQESIRARIEDALTLKAQEVVGTLVSQQRIDPTACFEEGESVLIDRLREKGIGHWLKAFTAKRQLEGSEDDKKLISIERVEFHSSFAAAAQLSKILGIEKEPAPNDAQAQLETAYEILKLRASEGVDLPEFIEQSASLGWMHRADLMAAHERLMAETVSTSER